LIDYRFGNKWDSYAYSYVPTLCNHKPVQTRRGSGEQIARAGVVDLASADALALERDLDRASARDLTSALALYLASTFTSDFARALDLYFTLFLLRERISGRLPAYEGILLVRERRDKEETT
jgi:hypothetical protein